MAATLKNKRKRSIARERNNFRQFYNLEMYLQLVFVHTHTKNCCTLLRMPAKGKLEWDGKGSKKELNHNWPVVSMGLEQLVNLVMQLDHTKINV